MSDKTNQDLAAQAIEVWLKQYPLAQAYALVDACQASELLARLQSQTVRPLRNLFSGAVAMSPGIQTVAPTFVPLHAHPDLLSLWPGYLGKHAGVLIRSSAKSIVLFKHLRKIFIVQDEAGQEHFLRFYDPRVLRVFLRASTATELVEFFGPIDAFLIEGSSVDCLETLGLENGQLREQTITLELAVQESAL